MQVTFNGRFGATRQFALVVVGAMVLGGAGPSRGDAQSSSAKQGIAPFSSVFLSTGTLLVDVSRLNPHFERLDLEVNQRPGFFTISNDAFSVGLGAYGTVLDRVVIGGEWQSADLGEEASPAGKTNGMSTTYVMGTLGYALFTRWNVNVIPFVGFGPGTLTLTLKDRLGGPGVSGTLDPTIDEIIASPGTESVVEGKYFMVQPGLAIDFIVLKQSSSTMGITLGMRLASSLSPNRTTWTYRGRSVFGGPDAGPTGGIIRIVAGFGGFRLGGAPAR